MSELKLSTGKHGRGVKFHEHNQKWEARIMVNKKRTTLGYFDTVAEAEAAYNAAKDAAADPQFNFLKPAEDDDDGR